ncbi:MAG: HD domain-containing protein [Candidatus Brockarchaeota archaeon]|nr:HD domain-containing protein [Candidatus Brockarchaeota archaeon]
MKERAGEEDDAYPIVLTAALLHDIGNQVHRENHHVAGVYLAIPLLNRLLPEIYENKEVMYEIRAYILNCIYSHEFDVKDLTEEASIIGMMEQIWLKEGENRFRQREREYSNCFRIKH